MPVAHPSQVEALAWCTKCEKHVYPGQPSFECHAHRWSWTPDQEAAANAKVQQVLDELKAERAND